LWPTLVTDLRIPAADGYSLAATYYLPPAAARGALIMCSAMAVRRGYYAAFAQAAAARGWAVLTYDYRGIGDSRPVSLRGFAARAADWMTLDFEGVFAWARREWQPARTVLVGHSFGGNALGLAPSAAQLDAGAIVAAGSGYWKHYAAPRRYLLATLWYVVAPLLPRLYGYVPRWAGLGDEVPAGVMLQWSGWCRRPRYALDDSSADGAGYARVTAPLRFVSLADDTDYAPLEAVQSLMSMYPAATVDLRQVQPHEHGLTRIGHFGFFRPQAAALWPLALDFLEQRQGART
jgi:predicted alpha/beta hydrolase